MSKQVAFPQAAHDWCKSNGVDASFKTVGASLTRQEFQEECDINSLMSKYEAHVGTGPGNLLPGPNKIPMYIDFAEIPDTLLGYMEFMDKAQASFMTLPAIVRKEFDNNAHQFVEYASAPENLEQMRSWGLAPPASAPPPAAASAAAPPAAGAPAAGNNQPGGSGGGSTHGST